MPHTIFPRNECTPFVSPPKGDSRMYMREIDASKDQDSYHPFELVPFCNSCVNGYNPCSYITLYGRHVNSLYLTFSILYAKIGLLTHIDIFQRRAQKRLVFKGER